MADRLTGKASYIIFNGTNISITKYDQDGDRKNADTTDSGDYDPNSDLIYPTQLPVSVMTKVSIEGRYRKSQTPGTIISAFYSGLTAIPVVLGLDAGTVAGHGNFDISNFKTSVPVDDTVTYTATLTSNGKFTPNS